MLKRLDSLLLRRAQWSCDKFSIITGFTKFRLQKWALMMGVVFCWGIIALSTLVFSVSISDAIWFCSAGLLYTVSAAFIIRRDEKEETEFLTNGKLRFSPWHIVFVRLYAAGFALGCAGFVLMMVPTVIGLLEACLQICFVAWVYFSACIPRPPGKSKAREWYEKLLHRLRDKFQPIPVPASS